MNSLYHNVLYDFWKDHYRIWFADYSIHTHKEKKIFFSDYASIRILFPILSKNNP